MKILVFLFALSITQPAQAGISINPKVKHSAFHRNKPKDRPKLITYHRPLNVFAPIKIGKESIWTAFALGLVLGGYAGQFFYSKQGDSRFMGVVLALVLVMELVIVLCHPLIWLIRWIRLLYWQAAWRKRYRLCPGQ